MMEKGRNDNHPKKGASIKVYPIRSLDAIAQIKANLKDQPRNLCLFTMGINTAYRANELLSLTVGQVAYLKAGDLLDIKQSKNKKYRPTAINSVTLDAVQYWLQHHPKAEHPDAPLFLSNRGDKALTVSALSNLVKKWCREIELSGNYGSHTLRKTWGYHQRVQNQTSVALLMRAYGHAKEAQTIEYLCVLQEEVVSLYYTLKL